MKKNPNQFLFFIFLILLVTTNLSAQSSGKINLAVMNLEAPDVPASAQQALSDRMRTELFNTGRFSVMERNQMQELLKEQGFQQSGCTSNECVVEAGKLLGVDRMIAGSVGKVGTIYTVSLWMIDIETGRIMLTKTEDCNCPIEQVLTTSLKNIALKMAGMSSSAEEQPVIRRETVAGQGDFYFKSDPPGASVYVDDQLISGTTPVMKEGFPAGTHQIRMERDVYSGSQTVFLEPNEFKKVELTLVKAKGGLKIVTTPLEVDIFLDNKPLGLSPQTLSGLDAGEHILKLSKADYLDHEEVVVVEGEKIKRLNIRMEIIRPAMLKITTQPPNCDVYVNSELKGRTPSVVRDLLPGQVNVKIVHPMYRDWIESVALKNGEVKEINPELAKKTGTLVVKSQPASAEVSIDGIAKGETPLTISDVEYGTHQLTISKTNYQSTEERVELASAEPKTISVSLVLAKGRLSVNGSPVGADIRIGGRLAGELPLENYEIDGGNYTIRITAKGYEPTTKMLNISPNERKDVSVQLARKSNSKAVVRSLFVPGLGQHYLEKKGRAFLFPVLEVGALAGAYIFNSKYNNSIQDYNALKNSYSTAIDQTKIDTYYSQMTSKYDDVESAEKMRNIFIGVAAGIWVLNVLDAAQFGPDTHQVGQSHQPNQTHFGISVYQINEKASVSVWYAF